MLRWPPTVAFTDSECCEFTGGPFSFLPATPRGAGFFIAWLFLLLWIFAGVALGADIFMTSIEVITSKDKKVMALGSSATIEIVALGDRDL